MVADAEIVIGHPLPTEYLRLLETQNGGYLRFSLPEMVHDQIAGIGPYFPSLTDFDWSRYQDDVSFPLDGLVPFDGDGHWHLCLDYRVNHRQPTVSYVDVECDHQTKIAESFTDYLSQLRFDVRDEEFVLGNVSDVEAIKSQLSDILGIEFLPPDTWAHGYPIHGARTGMPDAPQSIWLSPNIVPRGFVRTDDSRYAELRNLMPGNTPRYPNLPDSSYILFATEGIREKVLEACIKASLNPRPLPEYVS